MARRRPDLIARRKAAGYSSRETFAAACGVSPDTVKGWEHGQWNISGHRRPAVARALRWSLERLDDALNTIVDDSEPIVPHSTGVGATPVVEAHWVRNADIDQVLTMLAEQWHLLVRADNLIGPRHALAGLQQQMPLLTALLDHGPTAARDQTLRLLAQYAESASWLHEDLHDLTCARHWADRAVHMARTGAHSDLVTWGHFRRAQQTLTLGTSVDPHAAQQALQRLSDAHEEGRPQPSMRAALDAQHATALAVLGETRSADRMLDRAERYAHDRDDGDAKSGHGAFATPDWVALQRAWCWTILGRPRKALPLFATGLGALPGVYHRDRAGHLVRYACALHDAGHVDAAAHHARQAWELSHAVSSQRCAEQVRSLACSMRPYHRVAEVDALLTAVTGQGQEENGH